jgi:BMFP domain-containing protein YqiC
MKNKMNMFQILGIAIIINSLFFTVYLITSDKSLPSVISFLLCALAAGLALVFHEKVHELSLSLGKNPSLKLNLMVEQAESDIQAIAGIRRRIEAQAATLDLVAKESADARKNLEGLREENKKADEKIAMLEEKTKSIDQLPDGRVRMGMMITGEPTKVQSLYDDMIVKYKKQDFESAYITALECIKMFEDSKDAEGKTSISHNQYSIEGIANMYSYACDIALNLDSKKYDNAVIWGKKAVVIKPTAERKARLFLAFLKVKNNDAAKRLYNETVAMKNKESDEFEALLRKAHLIK